MGRGIKKMADQSQSATQAFNEVIKGVVKLHLVGGISLVLSGGAAALLFLALIFSTFDPELAGQIGKNSPRFYDITLVIGLAGALIGGLERFIEFRLSARRLEMMAKITEDLVHGFIQKNSQFGVSDVSGIVNAAFDSVWKNSALTHNKPADFGDTTAGISQTGR